MQTRAGPPHSRQQVGAASGRRVMYDPPLNSSNLTLYDSFSESNFTYGNQSLIDYIADQVAEFLNIYYTPPLVILGSIGNLVSVFVFYSSKLRQQSTSQYLSALALSDTLFLFQLLFPWLKAVQINGLFHHQGFCQVFVYISYVTCCLSAWLVVAFTVERFVAVLYPLRRNAVCTVTRARHVIGSIAAAALLLNLPVLWFVMPQPNDCNIDVTYLDHAERFNAVDTAVSFTIPLAVIIILNTWIMIGVWKLERTRHLLIKGERPAGPVGARRRARVVGCQRSQQRVTRMLLIVSTVFVVLNLPAYAIRILAYAVDWVSTLLRAYDSNFFRTSASLNALLAIGTLNTSCALISCISEVLLFFFYLCECLFNKFYYYDLNNNILL